MQVVVTIEIPDKPSPFYSNGEEQTEVAAVHEALCTTIHEMNLDHLSWLHRNVTNITVQLGKFNINSRGEASNV